MLEPMAFLDAEQTQARQLRDPRAQLHEQVVAAERKLLQRNSNPPACNRLIRSLAAWRHCQTEHLLLRTA